MGACCSTDFHVGVDSVQDHAIKGDELEDDDVTIIDNGSQIRVNGTSKFVSMYTQQGRKGINQDAMTVWEDFIGDKDTLFCGVFDGHGPFGHKVSRHVRNTLPSRLSSSLKSAQARAEKCDAMEGCPGGDNGRDEILLLSSWENSFVKCFNDMDEELSIDSSIDSFCSGATAVTVIKKVNHLAGGNLLIVGNLGDSRALLCTRGANSQLVAEQLTTDLKPNIASEAERIKKCNGRVFALADDPEVYRIWMPDEDCPGLAMARAFGDFCLKDYGLISVPQVSFRRLTKNDEFVVLATDGIWDVLSNSDVVKIVASVRNRSLAAKILVKFAVQAWRVKYPGSKVDDCAVICLYLKKKTILTRTFSEVSRVSVNHTELAENYSEVSRASMHRSEIASMPRKPGTFRERHVKND